MVEIPLASNEKMKLFVAYSRFEFSLKESDFLCGKEGDIPHANWQKFAKEEEISNILETLRGDDDVASLIRDPPQTQIVAGGHLGWHQKIKTPINSTAELLKCVKIVRDNLFHGGKSGENPRDDTLCRAATKTIETCLERHVDVKARFLGEY